MSLKRSSETITISGKFANSTDAFAVKQFDLQLNPLDQEVFVVTAVTIDYVASSPTPLNGITYLNEYAMKLPVAISTTRPTVQLDISNSSVFAYARQNVRMMFDVGAQEARSYTIWEESSDVPDTNLDYLAIIATSDFFVGSTDDPANQNDTDVSFRIWGYRAKADAATYAALVQSEVLSS